MKRKIVAAICVMGLLLAGCGGDFPNLSEEDAAAIGEYAAVTLLKYDANSRSRLVDLSQVEEEGNTDAPQPDLEENVDKPEASQPAPEKQPESQDTVADISGTEDTCGSMEEFLELPENVSIDYIGYETTSSYQEDNAYFVLEASEGKQLLVLRFALRNDSAQIHEINMLARQDYYRITVNENYTRAALTTMLSNDVSTYTDEMASGETVDLVLLVELDASWAENMQSIVLNLKNELKTYTIQLL